MAATLLALHSGTDEAKYVAARRWGGAKRARNLRGVNMRRVERGSQPQSSGDINEQKRRVNFAQYS